jgi:hypothetical protein
MFPLGSPFSESSGPAAVHALFNVANSVPVPDPGTGAQIDLLH